MWTQLLVQTYFLCGKVRKTTVGAILPHVRLYGSWEVEPIKDWNSYSSILSIMHVEDKINNTDIDVFSKL